MAQGVPNPPGGLRPLPSPEMLRAVDGLAAEKRRHRQQAPARAEKRVWQSNLRCARNPRRQPRFEARRYRDNGPVLRRRP